MRITQSRQTANTEKDVNHRGGRPSADLALMSIREIALREGLSVPTVERALRSAAVKLKAAGAYEGFIEMVKARQRGEPEGCYARIRCGSIECRPEKWAFRA